jgi:hypothetical protein
MAALCRTGSIAAPAGAPTLRVGSEAWTLVGIAQVKPDTLATEPDTLATELVTARARAAAGAATACAAPSL